MSHTTTEDAADAELVEGCVDERPLVIPEDACLIYPWGDARALETLPFVVTEDTLRGHNLNLFGFEKPQLVQIAHQFMLISAPDCRAFERELLLYIHAISLNYRDNPFHNFVHAVTVLHCAIVLTQDIDGAALTPTDRLGLYLSALVHDVNHPGHSNNFEKLINSNIAIRYNYQSVLENHHIAVSFALMKDPRSDFMKMLEPSARTHLKQIMRSCILATDMMLHASLVQSIAEKRGIGFNSSPEDRTLLCQILVHSADLFNPIRPFSIARVWAERISAEFNAQAEKETSLGFPLQSFLVTKNELKLAENELSFSSKFVVPLWESLSSIFPVFDQYHVQCVENIASWAAIRESCVERKDDTA